MARRIIRTSITELLKIASPVVSAPMAFGTSGQLAAKVTLAGGFGFSAAGVSDTNAIRSDLELARSTLHNGGRVSDSVLPIGIGYLGWILDKDSDSQEKIALALEARVAAIWFAFGNDLGKWIEFVRKYDNGRSVPHKTLIFVIVNSVEEAVRAAEQWKYEGIEAGGHGHSQAPPLYTLLPDVLRALPNGPPILAAGGITTGSQVASVLTLGASGAVVGTRFLFSPECIFSEKQKQLILDAKHGATIRSYAFDVAGGTTGWPDGIDGRALRNGIVDNYNQGLTGDEVRRRFLEAAKQGSPDGIITWAGVGVALVHELKKTEEIVKELHDDAVEHLQRIANLVTSP